MGIDLPVLKDIGLLMRSQRKINGRTGLREQADFCNRVMINFNLNKKHHTLLIFSRFSVNII